MGWAWIIEGLECQAEVSIGTFCLVRGTLNTDFIREMSQTELQERLSWEQMLGE